MTNKKNSITENIFKSTLKANLLVNFAYIIGPFLDGVFIGNYLGTQATAAYGMVWPVTLIYLIVLNTVSGGACIVYMHLVGEGRIKDANGVFTIANIMGLILSGTMVILTFVFSDTICILLGAGNNAQDLQPFIIGYLKGYCIGLPFQALTRIWAEYMVMDSDRNRNLYSIISLTVVDVIGNILVVCLFEGSMFGFGAASSAGCIACFFTYIAHFFRKNRVLRFDFSDLLSKVRYIKDIIISGTPQGVERLCSAASGIVMNHMIAGMLNEDYLALYCVQGQLISLLNFSYLGTSNTICSLSGIFFGEEDRKALDRLQVTAVKTVGPYILVLAAIVFFFPHLFFRVFLDTDSAEVISLGTEMVRVTALTLPLFMITYCFCRYMIGTKHIRESDIYIFLMQFGIDVPAAYLMIRCIGGRGIWFGNLIGLFIMCILAALYILFYRYGDTLNEKRLLLSEGFGTDEDKELVITAKNLKTVVGMSGIAEMFCVENGIDEIRANRFRLCLDEIGTNIVKHGFDDGKKHMIDIRLLIKKDELIIRIRDDCKPFDPVERYNMTVLDTKDPGRNMGIRMVMNMCKDVQYHSANNTNNLILKV